MPPKVTPMGVRAASRGAWTGATIAMSDGLTGAVTIEVARRHRSPVRPVRKISPG